MPYGFMSSFLCKNSRLLMLTGSSLEKVSNFSNILESNNNFLTFTKLYKHQNDSRMSAKLILGMAVSLGISFSHAQTFYSNGAQVAVMGGARMIVKSGSNPNDGSLENANGGLFKNKGEVHIEGSFVNSNGTADGYAANTGQYIVLENWVNDATFTPDQSTVRLNGLNQQITGTSVTTFYNLTCNNTQTVKSQTIDANVAGTLTLNGNELATNANKMTVLNTSANAIVTSGGDDAFVSSTGNGRLVRNTNSTDEYLFPLGWNNGGTPVKREVSFVPSDANAHSYEARFAFNTGSATTTTDDGYNITTKESSVDAVNDKFYHLLSASDNTPANLSVFFDVANDGNWFSVGRWEGAPQWTDLQNTNIAPASPRAKAVRAAWIDNSSAPHALVNPQSGDDFAFPNAFVPGATDPSVPVENRGFTVINNMGKVTVDELMVFNRWGEMVFNSKRDGTNTWDGMYQGKLQQQGNYTYLAKLRKITGEAIPPVSGNLSLIW